MYYCILLWQQTTWLAVQRNGDHIVALLILPEKSFIVWISLIVLLFRNMIVWL